jgi:hypothetical protein
MVATRSQTMREASPQQILKLFGGDRVKGNERKHHVYFADGKALVLVSIKKNKWGLVLVDEKGQLHQGQYVKHRLYPHRSGFDGDHFYWEAYIEHFFVLGKSVPPYFTSVEPTRWNDGWGFDATPPHGRAGHKGWGSKAGGAHGVMYDLSHLAWKQVRYV